MGNQTCNCEESPASHTDSSETVSMVFDLLSNTQRRLLLHSLSEHSGDTIALSALLDVVRQSWKPDTAIGDSSLEAHARHAHLPKLAEAGIIDYDDQNGRIRYHGHPLAEQFLEAIREVDKPQDEQ